MSKEPVSYDQLISEIGIPEEDPLPYYPNSFLSKDGWIQLPQLRPEVIYAKYQRNGETFYCAAIDSVYYDTLATLRFGKNFEYSFKTLEELANAIEQTFNRKVWLRDLLFKIGYTDFNIPVNILFSGLNLPELDSLEEFEYIKVESLVNKALSKVWDK